MMDVCGKTMREGVSINLLLNGYEKQSSFFSNSVVSVVTVSVVIESLETNSVVSTVDTTSVVPKMSLLHEITQINKNESINMSDTFFIIITILLYH
jgi:hypothetical protein